MDPFIQMLIWLLIAGFVFWALRQLVGIIPMEPIFKQVVDVVIIIVAVAIILFKVVIPLLHMLSSGGMKLSTLTLALA